jgi:threonine/homoserine/homoserine lactone efflux protein
VFGLFAIGVAIGALTGVPIGPVNVAVIDAAYRHSLRRAYATGAGGAVADFVYATLGIVGIGPALVRYPLLPRVLYAVSGVALVVYGAITVRTRPIEMVDGGGRAGAPRDDVWGGFTTGLALILLNPAALVTWVVIVGAYFAHVGPWGGLAASTGVFVGSVSWFALVAFLSHHGRRLMGAKAVWIPRAVGVLLIGYGGFSIVRAFA